MVHLGRGVRGLRVSRVSVKVMEEIKSSLILKAEGEGQGEGASALCRHRVKRACLCRVEGARVRPGQTRFEGRYTMTSRGGGSTDREGGSAFGRLSVSDPGR